MNEYFIVKLKSTNLRVKPDSKSQSIGKIHQGATVEKLRSRGGWHRVKVSSDVNLLTDITAWVSEKSLKDLDTGLNSNKNTFLPVTTSRFAIINAIEHLNPDQAYYHPRDITGDGMPETFCNWWVADVLDLLKIFLPRDPTAGSYLIPHPLFGRKPISKPISANRLWDFFSTGGNGRWVRIPNPQKALELANDNHIVVASIQVSGHGHIAIVTPGDPRLGIFVAQAGRVCSPHSTLQSAFPAMPGFFCYK
jgi:Bacterial SH3 domain